MHDRQGQLFFHVRKRQWPRARYDGVLTHKGHHSRTRGECHSLQPSVIPGISSVRWWVSTARMCIYVRRHHFLEIRLRKPIVLI